MADQDEDSIRAPSGPAHADDSDDPSDAETSDFRFLSTLTSAAAASSALPRRGIKDFEPHATSLQASALQGSRDAMRDALAHSRTHNPKGHVVGVYDAEAGTVRVAKARGTAFQSLGRAGRGGGTVLAPEEALWLLERGALDVRWPSVGEDVAEGAVEAGEETGEGEREGEDGGLPMSLQGAYAAFIGEEADRGGWLTLEKYQVYAHLKRTGFVVMRAEGWDGSGRAQRTEVQDYVPGSEQHAPEDQNILARLWKLVLKVNDESEEARHKRQSVGPLVKPGLYRSYDDIYRLTHLVPSAEPQTIPSDATKSRTQSGDPPNSASHPFTIHFNIYKPKPSFRKTAPGPPDFRICVVSARETSLPTLTQLDSLLSEQPLAPHHSEPGTGTVGSMYARLKQGKRNVLLAVVDEGVVSIVRMGEAVFGHEKLYERSSRAAPGGKRGGGGNRGRGRGRGRGQGNKG